MTPKNIVIVGAGNLGSRHLQALALTEIPLDVYVVDSSQKSLDLAKQRYEEMPFNPLVQNVTFCKDIQELNNNFEVAIIATPSKPRRMVIESLLIKNKVRYAILEKVLFPRMEDYDEVKHLLDRYNVKAWVNCGRRNNIFYKKMRELFKSEKNIFMTVSCSNLGIGCNSIHFLDTYSFITDQQNFSIDTDYLSKKIIPAKREGYIEFTGSVRFKSEKGTLLITSYQDAGVSDISTIQSENFFALICESKGYADLLIRKDLEWQKQSIIIKYQSQITQELIKDLILSEECGLPTYEESAKLHKVMLEGFLKHYQLYQEEGAEC